VLLYDKIRSLVEIARSRIYTPPRHSQTQTVQTQACI